jgi:hypothetical protein
MGWALRGSSSGNDLKYTAGRAGDDHYIQTDSGGDRDSFGGRQAQRLIVYCLLALMDPTTTITVETDGARTATIVELCDTAAHTVARYQIEETTGAACWSVPGYLGQSNPKLVDSAFTGYALMGLELWHLVHSGASYADYYPIGSW